MSAIIHRGQFPTMTELTSAHTEASVNDTLTTYSLLSQGPDSQKNLRKNPKYIIFFAKFILSLS